VENYWSLMFALGSPKMAVVWCILVFVNAGFDSGVSYYVICAVITQSYHVLFWTS